MQYSSAAAAAAAVVVVDVVVVAAVVGVVVVDGRNMCEGWPPAGSLKCSWLER
jgi:hypothetical protein